MHCSVNIPQDLELLTTSVLISPTDKPDTESTNATDEQSNAMATDPSADSEQSDFEFTESIVPDQQPPSHAEQLDASLADFTDANVKPTEPAAKEDSNVQSEQAEIMSFQASDEQSDDMEASSSDTKVGTEQPETIGDDAAYPDMSAATASITDTDSIQAASADDKHTLFQMGLTLASLGFSCAHLGLAVVVGGPLAAAVKVYGMFEKPSNELDDIQ